MTSQNSAGQVGAIPDGLPEPRRTLAFLTVAVAITMVVLDSSIVNVALPVIAAEQGADAVDAISVVSAYQLAVVVSLLPMAALGESIGFRRVYMWGLALFVLASMLCAMAPNIALLTGARVLQGLGGGALMSVNGALVRYIMPSNKLGRGISSVALVVAVAGAAGPTVASGILAISSWHWLFLINIPLGIIVLAVGRSTLPATIKTRQRFDWLSAGLNVLTFGFLISSLSAIADKAPLWSILGQMGIAVLAGVFMVNRQLSRPTPMLPVDLFRIPLFAHSVAASVMAFCAQFLIVVSMPFFLHDILGRNEVQTGLLMTPFAAATAVMAPIAGRLSDRYSSDWLAAGGMLILALGVLSIALLPPNPADLDIAWRMAVCGAGFGLFQSPNNRVMILSAPRQRAGGASGTQSTARLVGQSFGAALVGILVSMMGGLQIAVIMAVAAGFALCSASVALLRRRVR